ncbi:hypothetical protein HN51_054907 [Arachis hypogaea]
MRPVTGNRKVARFPGNDLPFVCKSSQDQGDTVDFSGPLISQIHIVHEILERHERHIRRTVRRSWFQKGKKNGK